jgi:hypothetical protein
VFIPSVPHSAEFERIDKLPRRSYSKEELAGLQRDLTRYLRTPVGNQTLLEPQAQACLELGQYRKLFCPMRPGSGKTLVTLLAPYILEAKRPLILVPGKLVEPTRNALAAYGRNWRVAFWVEIKSYQQLSRVSHERFLEDFKPDLIIPDEAHHLKNKRAGVTRRIKYYLQGTGKEVGCIFMPLSGTFSDRNPENFEHLAYWALGEDSPVAHTEKDLELWVTALGENLQGPRTRPGALLKWAKSAELADIREGFGKRVKDTPAVVATDSPLPPISITVTRCEIPSDPKIEEAFALLKAKWQTPDGFPLTKAVQVYALARQLKLGFFYRWNPRPDPEYILRRYTWGKFVRKHTQYSKTLLTELQVVQACERGDLDPEALNNWREIKATYTGVKEAVFISDIGLDWCSAWLKEPGICWTQHVEFGLELARRTGAPYHGAGGLDSNKVHIEQQRKGPIISSMGSSEGLNLQHKWWRNLSTTPPKLGKAWEQWMARTHRLQQPQDEVIFDILSGCRADEDSWDQALLDAEYLTRTDTLQRLQVADKIWNRPKILVGPRWKTLEKPEDD